jgi:proteic killer suppression protein
MRHVARYGTMIRTMRHQGPKRLFEQGDPSGVNPEHVGKLRNILATLQAARTVAHLDLPGFRLHPLKGAYKGFWAVTVRANWRVIFRFDGEAEDVDYVDYH